MCFSLNRRQATAVGLALFMLAAAPGPTAAQTGQLGDLTGPWQLFVDDYLVASRSGVVRAYHAFERYAGNPVLVPDRPYEGSISYVYGTVLPNPPHAAGPGYRMWYQCYAGGYLNLYAVSNDGIHWTKPNLGLVNYGGSTQNNILFRRTNEDHTPQVMHTPWDADPQRRYRMINFDYGRTAPDHTVSGYWGGTSPDGIVWIAPAEPANPVLKDPGDVGNFLWDPHLSRYTGYPKKFTTVRGFNRRCVGFSATTEFMSWPESRMILVPDEFDDRWVTQAGQRTEFYGLSAFPYESMYIGFLWVFRITDGNNDGPIFIELVTSHDGVNFVRQEQPRPPILPLGPSGSWEDGMVFTTNHPLVEGGLIKQWYGGFSNTHSQAGVPETAAVGLATLRKDGFASLDAGNEPGIVTTHKLVNTAGPLRLNYSAPSGSIRVEVLGDDGQPLAGYGRLDCDLLQGDSVDQPVTWGPLTELPAGSSSIRLRFILQDASLYSFTAGPDAKAATGTLAAAYTFEGDSGQSAADKMPTDGLTKLSFTDNAAVSEVSANAAFGSASAELSGNGSPMQYLEMDPTFTLGREFTLAAMVKSAISAPARLFTTAPGEGPDTLVLKMDPSGASGAGLCCEFKGAAVESPPLQFADGNYHHVGMTYTDGEVALFLDGQQVGQGTVPGGAVWLNSNLRVGQGSGQGGGGANPFARAFDDLPVNSPAGWAGGPRWFSNTPGLAGVTQADFRSSPGSLSLVGDEVGQKHYHGSWNGLKSDGVHDVSIVFNMKINTYTGNVAVLPFVYNNSAYGGNGSNDFGWPVNTNLSPEGVFAYYAEGTGSITMISVPRTDLNGQWVRYTAKLHPTSRTADVSVTVLTGPQAGTTGGVVGQHFQHGVAADYYGSAMDDLGGTGFLLDGFTAAHQMLIDDLVVRVQNGETIPDGTGEQLIGFVDDVVVLGRALSPAQMQQLAGQGVQVLVDAPLKPDFDLDGDVDLADFNRMQQCFSGPSVAQQDLRCLEVRLDADEDIDMEDFGLFQVCLSGPEAPPDPACDVWN